MTLPANSQEGLDIQVTVNSSDDEYQEESQSGSNDENSTNESSPSELEDSEGEMRDQGCQGEQFDPEASFQVLPEHMEQTRDDQSHGGDLINNLDILREDPRFHQLVFDVLGHGGNEMSKEQKKKGNKKKHKRKGMRKVATVSTPKLIRDKTINMENKIKSPSDTTIYAPALKQKLRSWHSALSTFNYPSNS